VWHIELVLPVLADQPSRIAIHDRDSGIGNWTQFESVV
jgi:hypothetical protein